MVLRAAGPASIRQMWHLISGTRLTASAARRCVRLPGGFATRRPQETLAMGHFRSLPVVPALALVGPAHGKSLRLVLQQKRSVSAAVAVPAEHESSAEPAEPKETTTSPYKLVTFYAFPEGGIAEPRVEAEVQKEFCKARDIRGRIYLNEQGINAQLSGRGDDALEYAKFVISRNPRFEGTRVSVYDIPEHGFPKLTLRYKANLVQLNGGTRHLDLSNADTRAQHLTPDEWRAKLAERADGRGPPILLDVRNGYEWDAGRFEGAGRPPTESFRDTVEAYSAPGGPLDGVSADTPVMMYCTGGIRCDVYSAVLKEKGFTNMYTLSGGVQAYLDKFGTDRWEGHLFVFDSRLAMTPDRQPSALAAGAALKCFCCGADRAAAPHRNCPNVDCNRLFLVCSACLQGNGGFCCRACASATHVRPALISAGKHYTRWFHYADGEHVVASRRGDGRKLRKQRRRERRLDVSVQRAIVAAAAELGVDVAYLSPEQISSAATGAQAAAQGQGQGQGQGGGEGGADSGTMLRRTRPALIAQALANLKANGGRVIARAGEEDESGSEGEEEDGGGKEESSTKRSRHAKQRRVLKDEVAAVLNLVARGGSALPAEQQPQAGGAR